MTRYAAIQLYVGIVVLTILALQGSGLHGLPWFLRVLALPAVPVAIMAYAARRRMARGPQDVAPWETKGRLTTPDYSPRPLSARAPRSPAVGTAATTRSTTPAASSSGSSWAPSADSWSTRSPRGGSGEPRRKTPMIVRYEVKRGGSLVAYLHDARGVETVAAASAVTLAVTDRETGEVFLLDKHHRRSDGGIAWRLR